MSYSEACNICQLYQQSSYYKANILQSFAHLSPDKYDGKFVLVVTSTAESHGGYYPPESKASQFLFDCLKRLSVPYAVTSSLKCAPDAYYNQKDKLKMAHQCCATFTWNDVMSLYNSGRLGAVVCLGATAMQTILPESKLRVDQAKHGIHWIGPVEAQIPVLVTNAPNVHFQDYNEGGKDLRQEYISVFGLAERIATGQYVKANFNTEYLVYQNWGEVDTWLALNPDYLKATHIVLDVESNINPNIKNRCTVFHEDTKILCFTIRFKDTEGNKKIIVVRTRDLSKPECYQWIKYLVLGCGVPKKVCGSNILFDLCHILACSLPMTIEEPLNFMYALPGIHDWFQWHFIMDQGRIGNGQKDLVTHYFREPDYSVPIRDRIAQLKKSGVTHPDYGDIYPYEELEYYCGLDGGWGGELLDICLGDMENEEHELYVPYMAKLDEIRGAVLSSLLGIPVDLSHFAKAQAEAEALIKQTSDWLDQHPFVKHCGYDKCNTKSVKLMSMLVDLTLYHHPHLAEKMRKTPSGLWQVSDETRPILCAIESDIGHMWKAIDKNRQMRDFISKSLDMPNYYATDIYKDGIHRIHPMWRISKSDFNQQGGEVKEGKSEGTDTSRWACIAQGTYIECPRDLTVNPNGVKIEDIRAGDYVYGYNNKGELLLQKVAWAGMTGVKETITLQWRGGFASRKGSLCLTPEHLVRLVNGDWVRADSLKKGDRVMAMSRGVYEGRARLYPTGGGWVPEQRAIAKCLGWGDNHVHHKDEQTLNNNLNNLVPLTSSEHTSFHNSTHIEKFTLLRLLARNQGGPKKSSIDYGCDYSTIVRYCQTHNLNLKKIQKRYDGKGKYLSRGRVKRALDRDYTSTNDIQKILNIGYYRVQELCENYGLIPINHVIESIDPGPLLPVYDISLGDGEPCFIANEIAVHNSEPNVQNIMARGDQNLVSMVRRGYIAIPGFTLVNSDLKTIEPVLLAWISGSQRMKDIFLLGVHEPNNPLADYYRNLGSHFFKITNPSITPATVTKEMRVVAKNDILLALQYGRSPHALSQVLGCTYEQADMLLKQFFYELYPETFVAYEDVRYKVFYGQEVVTVTGTRQKFPLQNLYDYDRTKHYWLLPYELAKVLNITPHDQHMLRKAWNFVFQGPAAQINNSGLVQIHDDRNADRQLAHHLQGAQMSVHDALVYQMLTRRLQELVDYVVTVLYDPERLDELGFNFGFTKDANPLRGEVKAGTNYFDMEEMEWKRIR